MALTLHEAGLLGEAMSHYSWCFDHGCEADPSFSSVRVSFLIGYMSKLGDDLPDCRIFLEERRSSLESEFVRASLPFQDAQLLFALNRELKKQELTLLAIAHKTISNTWTALAFRDALNLAASDIRFWKHCDRVSALATAYTISLLSARYLARGEPAGCEVKYTEHHSPEVGAAVRAFANAAFGVLAAAGASEMLDVSALELFWQEG